MMTAREAGRRWRRALLRGTPMALAAGLLGCESPAELPQEPIAPAASQAGGRWSEWSAAGWPERGRIRTRVRR